METNCFKCYGFYQECDSYAVMNESRLCYYKNIATMDLIKFNNNSCLISISKRSFEMLKDFFKNDVESTEKLSRLEKIILTANKFH